MGIYLMLLAGIFVGASNFCFRKSIDAGGNSRSYLMIQLFLVFLVAILLNPVRTGNYEWSACMSAFGFSGGLILAGMMVCLGKALEIGPPALTFAALNASTVMPMVLMSLIFGVRFGFNYTLWHAIGSLLVIAGLFWAAGSMQAIGRMQRWIAFVTGAFALHVVFLVFMQWRALFINFSEERGLFLSFDATDARNQWFMPAIFLAAAFVQILIYAVSERRLPKKMEIFYGVIGGTINGIGTYFMIWSTEVSTSLEHAMIFPIFAISVILVCNAWGRWFYKEKINWMANALCILGILVGTLDWSRF